jgi:exodeoxyribonuclease V alpha subunit
MPDLLIGEVYSVVFNSEDYYILNFDAIGHRSVKAKGNLHGLIQVREGTPIKLVGAWGYHAKYGREFNIHTWEPWSENVRQIARFLNICVHGFSDSRVVEAVVRRYGIETYDQLTHKGTEIQQQVFEDVASDSIDRALLGWGRTLAQRDLSLLLKDGGLTAGETQLALNRFGMEAKAVITSNPFRLMEIAGLSYAKVDRLALHLGVDAQDPRRIQGAVLWALQEATKQGHLYLRRAELGVVIGDLIQHEPMAPLPLGKEPSKSYNEAIVELLRQKAVVFDPEAGLYLPDLYSYERQSAALLVAQSMDVPLNLELGSFIEIYERAHRIRLSEAQRLAVELLIKHRGLVITGLPGTGKTTVLRAIVRLLEEAKQTFVLMAPTGIAAKRLSAVTGHPASTVHRALKYDGDAWGYHSNNRYVVDAVVLDEASMLDQELLFRLLSAIRPETRLVFVGDDAQLPSVGPGNVLREMIDCGKVPHVRLTEIFRQSVKGEIVVNSHKINSGKMPDLTSQNSESEFRFVRCPDENRIAELIVQMATKLKGRDANFQVLSPKYDGVVGVTQLNERLRDALNPEGPMEWVRGKTRFRMGDRLMVIQNDYELNVYNGDVGKLSEIGRDGLAVKIHGVGENAMDMVVPFKSETAATKLRLAYCITAHKSQGSEFDTIIMPITRSQGRMLQRNLLYTAVTRARKRVWLIGEEIAVQKAVENNKVIRRNTIFSRAIASALEAGVRPADALKQAESEAEGAPSKAGDPDPVRQDHSILLDRGS